MKRCDMKDCFEEAPYSLSVFGTNPKDVDGDTIELWDFELCKKHYFRMRGRMTVSVNGT